MTTRRVSLLVGLLCLIASTSVAAAPAFEGKISGVEWCWQDNPLCDYAAFSGSYNGKVYDEHDTGFFSAIVKHGALPKPGSEPAPITEGYWLIWTSLGYFEGTVTGGTLTATKNVNRFDVTVDLLMTNGPAKFVGVLDHSGLLKQPIQPPTIRGDVFSFQ
jgi:hypothetical protein